jgi:hypothetical protein
MLQPPAERTEQFQERMHTRFAQGSEQIANAGLMLRLDAVADRTARGSQGNQEDAAIPRTRRPRCPTGVFQSIDDSGHVAFVGEQCAAEVNHRAPLLLVEVLKCPELARVQIVLRKEAAIMIVEQ